MSRWKFSEEDFRRSEPLVVVFRPALDGSCTVAVETRLIASVFMEVWSSW
jgi:hypothetical protein